MKAMIAAVRVEDLRLLAKLATSGAYTPVIDRTYPFEQLVEAHRYVDAGHKKGNVVIKVGDGMRATAGCGTMTGNTHNTPMSITRPGEGGDSALETTKHVEAVKPNTEVESTVADLVQMFNEPHAKTEKKTSVEVSAKSQLRDMLWREKFDEAQKLMDAQKMSPLARQELVTSMIVPMLEVGFHDSIAKLLSVFPLPMEVLDAPEIQSTATKKLITYLTGSFSSPEKAANMIRILNLPGEMIAAATENAYAYFMSTGRTDAAAQLRAAYPLPEEATK